MSSTNLPLPLQGTRVLICRPEPAASELAKALSALGATCKTLPAIEIEALELDGEARQKILNLDQYQHVIALSQHGAALAADLVDQYWPQLPVGVMWHAIGRKTALTLIDHDIPIAPPSGDMTSEQLLSQPAFIDFSNKATPTEVEHFPPSTEPEAPRILLLKGKQGRQKLAETLRQRGAVVEGLELYQRMCPDYSEPQLRAALIEFEPQFVVALSGETLENLHSFCKTTGAPKETMKMILSSQRVAKLATSLGFPLSYVPDNLMPMDIVRSIISANRSTD